MNTWENLQNQIEEIEKVLGYTFKDKKLILLAFVHRSFINENKQIQEHNERLEFLGDSILGLLIADFLYNKMPTTPEGELSYLRSRLVEATSCFNYVIALDLQKHLLLGKGERMNDGRGRESIIADLFEAIIGALYLDGGLEAAKTFLLSKCRAEINKILKTPVSNWKALLQDFCQKKYQKPPEYNLISEAGPDHSKQFIISVSINNEVIGKGEGPSKKEAQQSAAEDALKKIDKAHGNQTKDFLQL